LPTALLSQVSSAKAEPAAKVATIAARKIRFIMGVSLGQNYRADWSRESWRNQAGSMRATTDVADFSIHLRFRFRARAVS
jgi:hypothetical protein